MLTSIILFLVLGAIAGVLAGLMGVGGGIVIVPMLNFAFAMLAFPQDVIQLMALGTSMASIMFTSVSSFRAHNKRGAVIWRIVACITPGIIIGTLVGTRIAAYLPITILKAVFVVFLFLVSIQMFMNFKPKPSRELKSIVTISIIGVVIGIISGLVGIGGGTVSVPTMVWHNIPMHTAVGTSSAIGLPIAISGALGYIINGWNDPLLPQYSLGYVYLPALICIVATSVLTAPLGVRLAHRLPVPKLKRAFAVLLLIVAIRMLWGLL